MKKRRAMSTSDYAFAGGIALLAVIQIAEPLWLWLKGWWIR